MKIVMNPDYPELEDYVKSIPFNNYEGDRIIRAIRNVIGRVEVAGHDLVIKRYKVPTHFNRIMYTFFRKSKGRRAYEHAVRLKSAGFHTADPVAYIEIKEKGLFHTGYFVSLYVPYPLLDDFYTHDEPTRAQLLDDFTDYTLMLHDKGIIHSDFNLSNVLYFRNGDKYDFSLIDINRMSFGSRSKNKILKSFKTLTFKDWTCVEMVEKYALARGWDPEVTASKVLYKKGHDMKRRIKRAVKALLGRERRR